MVRKWCCCVSNLVGAIAIAIVEIVVEVLGLLSLLFRDDVRDNRVSLYIALAIQLVASLCLLTGALRRNANLILVWVILTLIAFVLILIQVIITIVAGGVAWGIAYFVIGVLIRLWLLLVGVGARQEVLYGEGAGHV